MRNAVQVFPQIINSPLVMRCRARPLWFLAVALPADN
jgi:hypothetical protein